MMMIMNNIKSTRKWRQLKVRMPVFKYYNTNMMQHNHNNNHILNFNDHKSAFQSKSTLELMHALIVLKICSWKYLIDNGTKAYDNMSKLFGRSLINTIIRNTFFKHFCAGENANETKKTMNTLLNNGVGSILGYSSEQDINDIVDNFEDVNDRNFEVFMNCISLAGQVDNNFTAIKVTALARPILLERISIILDKNNDKYNQQLLINNLNNDELIEYDRIMERLRQLAQYALDCNVRLLIDAEQTYFQLAISHIVLQLQNEFNRNDIPIIFNTYQCYLTNTFEQVQNDMDYCRKEGFKFAGKIVRGAYIVTERARAEEFGYQSPCWANIEATHKCYNKTIEFILQNIDISNVVVASHNQATADNAAQLMDKYNIDKSEGGVYFAQLLGMSDNITMVLGNNNYKVYKYVPYGPIEEVVPYLLRRAQENSSVLGSEASKNERVLLRNELYRRLFRINSKFI